MGIPEHDKCVKMWKRIRQSRKYGNWRKVRSMRRRSGELKPKERIRNIIKASKFENKSRIQKFMSFADFNKEVFGGHYRRWGKYDD